jgi:hypothetical protein
MLLVPLAPHGDQADRSQFGQFALHGTGARAGKRNDFVGVEAAAWIPEKNAQHTLLDLRK